MSSSISASSQSRASGTSRTLISCLKANDPEGWRRLVKLYSPLVMHWCRKRNLQDADLADVFQDVFLAVAKGMASFRKERPHDTFRGWLRTIVERKIADHFRRLGHVPIAWGGSEAQQRFARLPQITAADNSTIGSDESSEPSVLRHALAAIRGEFHENTWQAFWRTAVDGQTAAEIAHELSMSPVAVRVAKSRVLRRLREELGDLE
jgi:RNA polymerase sigma-70 factor (ECF subfamily)